MGAIARIEVAGLLATLDALPALPQKVAYALARGRAQVKAIAREIETRQKDAYSDDVVAYIDASKALAGDHLAKDEQGQPIPEGNGWKLKDPEAYKAAQAQLEADSTEAAAKLKAQDRALYDWLRETVELEAWSIPAGAELPDLTVAQAEVLVLLTVEA